MSLGCEQKKTFEDVILSLGETLIDILEKTINRAIYESLLAALVNFEFKLPSY